MADETKDAIEAAMERLAVAAATIAEKVDSLIEREHRSINADKLAETE